jgi:hypothetical protein
MTKDTPRNEKVKCAKRTSLTPIDEAKNTTIVEKSTNQQIDKEKALAKQMAEHKAKQEQWKINAAILFDKLNLQCNKQDFIQNPTIASAQPKISMRLQEDLEELNKLKRDWSDLFPENSITYELNKKYGVIEWNGQFYILKETNNGRDFNLSNKQSFKDLYENQTIKLPNGKIETHAQIYLKHKERRTFHGIVFNPTQAAHIKLDDETYYNIWKGFTVNAKEGTDITLFLDHIKVVICSSDQGVIEFVMDWLARLFQFPNVLSHGIVLIGKPGTGKNTFVDTIGELLGNHYLPLDNISQVTSNFNFHQKNAVLIHANEAFWGGNKKDLGKIKGLITDKDFYIEPKGKDPIKVPNFRHLIISSNEDYPVHLDNDDRRFLVLQVSNKYQKNTEYFEKLHKLLGSTGAKEAILHWFLNYKIKNMRSNLPRTTESFELKIKSANSDTRYIYNALISGGFSIHQEIDDCVWQPIIPKASVYEDYSKWCKNNAEELVTNTDFGKTLFKLLPSTGKPRPNIKGTRIQCYEFENLKNTRSEFCKSFDTDIDKIFKD